MSDVAAGPQPQIVRRSPRWMWVILILSLSVNLLIVGIVAGSIWAVKRGGYWNVPTTIERNHRFMRALPDERREQIKTIFFEHKAELKPFWRDVRDARGDIARLLRSERYSQAELDAAMETLFQREMRAWQAAKPMLNTMLDKLSVDERMHFLRVFVPYLEDAQSQAEVRLPQ
ncbi:MAG: periplasmic heavy metal sensor [Rhodomicrobiaceae bacterium]